MDRQNSVFQDTSWPLSIMKIYNWRGLTLQKRFWFYILILNPDMDDFLQLLISGDCLLCRRCQHCPASALSLAGISTHEWAVHVSFTKWDALKVQLVCSARDSAHDIHKEYFQSQIYWKILKNGEAIICMTWETGSLTYDIGHFQRDAEFRTDLCLPACKVLPLSMTW